MIRRSRKGRGVYADKHYAKGEVIERCPIIFVPYREIRPDGILIYYVFDLGEGRHGVVLGHGMLYNHSDEPNTTYGLVRKSMVFRALRAIKRGEELVIDYDNGPMLLDARRARYARGD